MPMFFVVLLCCSEKGKSKIYVCALLITVMMTVQVIRGYQIIPKPLILGFRVTGIWIIHDYLPIPSVQFCVSDHEKGK